MSRSRPNELSKGPFQMQLDAPLSRVNHSLGNVSLGLIEWWASWTTQMHLPCLLGELISSPFYEGIHEIVRNLVTT